MSKVAIICAYCGCGSMKESGGVTRSLRKGAPLYCNRECAGKDRRVFKTKAQRVAEKAAYDAEYREKNRERLKAEKAARYRANPNRERERAYREANMHRHVEYCRRPEYRKWKADYDRKHRSQKLYGPFAEAFLALSDLEAEIAARATRYEIYTANGTLNKCLNRRRDYERQTDRR